MDRRPDADEVESIEQAAWIDMFAAAPAAFVQAAGMRHQSFTEIEAFALKAAPAVQFNRAQGFGLNRGGAAELDHIVAWLRQHCGPAWALQVPDTSRSDTLDAQIEACDLAAAGSWTKFVHSGTTIATAPTDLRIESVEADRGADFGRVVQLGFGAPPPFAAWASQLAGRPRWSCFVAYDGDMPVAGGALYLDRGLGWAGLGCCIATHRGRGAQSALLARRIALAKDLGARAVVSETGTPAAEAPGPHPSFHNLNKMGFVQSYRRVNYRPREQLS
jgi:hypothetical protein